MQANTGILLKYMRNIYGNRMQILNCELTPFFSITDCIIQTQKVHIVLLSKGLSGSDVKDIASDLKHPYLIVPMSWMNGSKWRDMIDVLIDYISSS